MAQKVYKDVNQMLHDFAMDKIFTPENAAAVKGSMPESEPLFKKGERVTFVNPRYKDQKGWQDDHEILGFMHGGELVDENHSSPYDKHYGIRVKNSKTGEEMWTPASYLKRIKGE